MILLKVNKCYIDYFNEHDATFIKVLEDVGSSVVECEVVNFSLQSIFKKRIIDKFEIEPNEKFFEIKPEEYEQAKYLIQNINTNKELLLEHIQGLTFRE